MPLFRPRVLCVGCICVDTVVLLDDNDRREEHLVRVARLADSVGGCCGNTATALARLGADVTIAALVADDPAGQFAQRHLREYGIANTLPMVNGSTSRCLVLTNPKIDHRRFLYAGGVSEELDLDCCLRTDLARFDALLIADPFLTRVGRTNLAVLLAKAKQANLITVLSLCWDPEGVWGRNQLDYLDNVDILIGNSAEISHFSKGATLPESTRILDEAGATAVIVTRGALGMVVRQGGDLWEQPAAPTTTVDSTGAGDWCAAGVLLGYLKTASMRAAVRVGALAGAAAVSEIGGSGALLSQSLMSLLEV